MKKFLLLTCNLLLTITLFAWQPVGTYKSGLDSLVFIDGKATFRITSFTGLSTAKVGEGTFEQIENFLLIKTTDYSGPKSSYQTRAGSLKDSCIVKVVGMQKYPLQNILVEACTNSGKIVEGKVTGNDGQVYFRNDNKIKKIVVSDMYYDDITIDCTPGKNYLVTLAENEIIENSTVAFSVRSVDDETIFLLLLTDDFKGGRNRLADLQKLEKKVRERNPLEKQLKKVYVPYERKI